MTVATKKAKTWTANGVVFRSPLEQRFYKAWIKAHSTTLIVPQFRVVTAEGKPRLDFALPLYRLAIEIDGAAWHRNPIDAEKDRVRDLRLGECGWQVVRIRGEEMQRVKACVERVWGEVEAARVADREVGAR